MVFTTIPVLLVVALAGDEASEVFTTAYCDFAYSPSATADAASLTKQCSLVGDMICSLVVDRGTGGYVLIHYGNSIGG